MPILKGKAGNETDKAILFSVMSIIYPNGNEQPLDRPLQGWYPLSHVTKITRNPNLDALDEIHVSEWIAEKKGLYYELD